MTARGADIVLAICPPWGVVNPPLGLAYLAVNLRKRALTVDVLDINVRLFLAATDEDRRLWQIESDHTWRSDEKVEELFHRWRDASDALIQRIIGSRAPVIGFSVIDPNEFFTYRFIRLLKAKAPDLVVIAGGPGCDSKRNRKFLFHQSDRSIDFFLVGEGEHALSEFLIARKAAGDSAEIPQLIDARGDLERTGSSPPVDLDTVAFPTFEEFDMRAYSGESLAVMWSRGCIGRCLYCKEKALWGRYRPRSVKSIIQELEYHTSHHHLTDFVVYDSAINGRPRHLDAICDALLDRSRGITWSGEAIALPSMTDELLGKMRRAGCHTLVYGIESGSDKVLASMEKLNSSAEAGEVLRRTHEAGIKVAVNILVGFPGEAEEDFQMTVDFLRGHTRWIDRLDGASTLQVVMGTPLAQRSHDFNIVLPEFEPHDKWYTEDRQNTHEVRQRRLERILAVAADEGLEIGRTFLDA